MSGILNSKERIFYTYITEEGRRQMADGQFQAKYYSFTDGVSIYQIDTILTSSEGNKNNFDETYRLCFEASSLPQDQVTFEASDAGKLVNPKNNFLTVLNGQIFSGLNIVTGSAFASTAGILLSSSLNSYKNLKILSSPLAFNENKNDFLIGNRLINFKITNDRPIYSTDIQKISINQIESLFMDKRLSHIPNFQFLPPVNKAPVGGTTSPLGDFKNLNQKSIETYEELENELKFFEQIGFKETIKFTETSPENNLFSQIFEVSNDQVIKLDVIDFGIFLSKTQKEASNKHVFFVGKVFIDNMGSSTFVNMFTLVFE